MFLKGPTVGISNCHQPSQNVQSICCLSKRAEALTVPRNAKYPARLYCCCCSVVGLESGLFVLQHCEEWRLLRFKNNISLLEHFIFSMQSAPLNSPTGRREEVNRLSLHICLIVYAHLISITPPDIPVNWQLSKTPQSYSGLQLRFY